MHWGTREIGNKSPRAPLIKEPEAKLTQTKWVFLRNQWGHEQECLNFTWVKKKKKKGGRGEDNFIEDRVTKAAFLAQAALDPGMAFREMMTRIPPQASSPGCYWKGHIG